MTIKNEHFEKGIAELEKFRKGVCDNHQCNDCPLYNLYENEKDICWMIRKLKTADI